MEGEQAHTHPSARAPWRSTSGRPRSADGDAALRAGALRARPHDDARTGAPQRTARRLRQRHAHRGPAGTDRRGAPRDRPAAAAHAERHPRPPARPHRRRAARRGAASRAVRAGAAPCPPSARPQRPAARRMRRGAARPRCRARSTPPRPSRPGSCRPTCSRRACGSAARRSGSATARRRSSALEPRGLDEPSVGPCHHWKAYSPSEYRGHRRRLRAPRRAGTTCRPLGRAAAVAEQLAEAGEVERLREYRPCEPIASPTRSVIMRASPAIPAGFQSFSRDDLVERLAVDRLEHPAEHLRVAAVVGELRALRRDARQRRQELVAASARSAPFVYRSRITWTHCWTWVLTTSTGVPSSQCTPDSISSRLRIVVPSHAVPRSFGM